MANPFDNDSALYRVLTNHEGQHSLWPVSTTVPEGWSAVFGPSKRGECLEYVESHWTDMRPLSLVEQSGH